MVSPENKNKIPSEKEAASEKQTTLTGLFAETLDFIAKRDKKGSEQRAGNLVRSASQLVRQEYLKYRGLGFEGKELSGFPIRIMDSRKLKEKFIEQGLKASAVKEKEIPQEVFLITDDSLDELDLVIVYPQDNYYLGYYCGSKKEYLKFIGNQTEKKGSVELTIVRDRVLPPESNNLSVDALFKEAQSGKGERTNSMIPLPKEVSLDPFPFEKKEDI